MSSVEQRQGAQETAARDELLERAGELSELDSALASARRGAGRVVLVEGEPGIGKSRLLRAARERARAADMRLLSAWGFELEREFPFGAVRRLLEPALDGLDPARRRRLFCGVASSAAALFEGGGHLSVSEGADHGRALVRAVRQLVVNLAADASEAEPCSLAIVLDDAQWCDAASLSLLAHLSADVGMLPIAIVVAAHPDALDATGIIRRGLAAAPQARVLRLRPLSARAVEQVVHGVYPEAAAAFVGACAHATRGNPFYLRELLQAARADGIPPTATGAAEVEALAPESVVHAVLVRLARLPDPAPALASAVAVLGDGCRLRDAAALAQIGGEAAEEAADLLAAAYILRPGYPLIFTHPLIATAVYADLPALARSRAHRRAADLLADHEAPVETVAAHLLACRPDGDRRVVELLSVAAEQASGRGEFSAAQRLLERALAEPPAPELRGGLLVARAMANAATGAPDAVARVHDALKIVEPERRVDALRSLARLLFSRSEFAAASETVEEALRELSSEDPRRAELLVESLAIASVGASTPPPPAAARLATILREAHRGRLPTEPGLLAQLAGAMVAAGRPAGEVAATARAALAGLSIDDGFYGIITGFAVLALIGVDQHTPAAARIDALMEQAHAAGSLITTGMVSHWRSLLRYREGDLGGALVAGQQTLDVAHAGWDLCKGWVAPVIAHAHMDRGDLAAAAEALRVSDDLDAARSERALARAARGRLAALNGDPATGAEHLLAAGVEIEQRGIGQLMAVPWRSAAALAIAATGNRTEAEELVQTELTTAQTVGAPRRLGIALRVAGLTTGAAESLDRLREAVKVLQRSPARLELAHALVELGTLLRRCGQPTASREPLRNGFDLAHLLGARPLADRAQHELHAAGGRRRPHRTSSGPGALTPTERRIAELAASGLTTPQIATTLYITTKTVDWHLGHAYRKLGINSRRALPDALTTRCATATAATESPWAAPREDG